MNVEIFKEKETVIKLKVGEKGADYIHYFFYKDGKPFDLTDFGIQLKIWFTENSGMGATIKEGKEINEGIGSAYYALTVRPARYKAVIMMKNAVEGTSETFEHIIFEIEEQEA